LVCLITFVIFKTYFPTSTNVGNNKTCPKCYKHNAGPFLFEALKISMFLIMFKSLKICSICL
jgi:hypothetical protein